MKSLFRHRFWKWPALLLASLFISVSGVVISDLTPFRYLEYKWMDMLFEIRGPVSTLDSPVVLVAINEASELELPEKYPWPTSYYARLIHNLNEAGAKVIAFDVIFDKNDIYDPRNDTLFAQAIAEYGNVILAGNVLREVQRATNVEMRSLVDAQKLVQPMHLLNQANPNRWGFVAVDRDSDGFLRRYPLTLRHFDETYNSFAIEVLRLYKSLPYEAINDTPAGLYLGETLIPRWDNYNTFINYVGPPGSFPEFSLSDVIDTEDFFTESEDEFFQINAFDDPDFGLLHQEVFKDKIVLIGSTLPELHDFYPTPFAPRGNMPGYESHANAIQTILSQSFITRASLKDLYLLIFGIGLLVVILTQALPVRSGAFLAIALIAGYVFLVIWLFTEKRFVLELVGPLTTFVVGYVTITVYGYFREQREKKRIQSMFGSYVAPEIVNKIIASGEEPRLGGDSSYITAFFSDIQSFSSFSEKLTPEQLVELMNEYLSAMTDILIEEGGTLDKYIGDAIVAFFGAPVPSTDHALRACVTAQRMMEKQVELREKWRSEGNKWPALVWNMTTRIGLNTGTVITGNMGSLKRFNYTMMGDDVNLAARCESGAKLYGVHVMITGQTRREAEEASNEFLFRELDRIIVKGRSLPVTVHQIVGFRKNCSENDLVCVRLYEEGLQKYYQKKWDEARDLFAESAKLERSQPQNENDIRANPSVCMLHRLGEMRTANLPADWNGTYVMKSK